MSLLSFTCFIVSTILWSWYSGSFQSLKFTYRRYRSGISKMAAVRYILLYDSAERMTPTIKGAMTGGRLPAVRKSPRILPVFSSTEKLSRKISRLKTKIELMVKEVINKMAIIKGILKKDNPRRAIASRIIRPIVTLKFPIFIIDL